MAAEIDHRRLAGSFYASADRRTIAQTKQEDAAKCIVCGFYRGVCVQPLPDIFNHCSDFILRLLACSSSLVSFDPPSLHPLVAQSARNQLALAEKGMCGTT